ncbi:MAG: hypothetical protein M1827_000901 [Pycnora praestabilis]|nr:MAG: hypothetical protein M1827_000901 [Pycnora praestabilis]
MPALRRALTVLLIAFLVAVGTLFYSFDLKQAWTSSLLHFNGTGDAVLGSGKATKATKTNGKFDGSGQTYASLYDQKPKFKPGTPKSPGSNYSRILIVPRTTEENITWISSEIPDLEAVIYTANDPHASLHPPKNKGHEVMIYLSYIIDNYDTLPDIMLFMHAHRYSWHNDDILDNDAVQMIQQLSNERVMREGYVNLRCHWSPGCPEWLHPASLEANVGKQEEPLVARAWSEIFPNEPIPETLGQPCCAQFALSRDRVRSIPLNQYTQYRDWLLRTTLTDYVSGRVFEYAWQFVFTGNTILCPAMHICYCDGFGVCFGGEAPFNDYFQLRFQKYIYELELSDWRAKEKAINDKKGEGGGLDLLDDYGGKMEVPEMGRDVYLESQVEALGAELVERKRKALERGGDPRIRAEEAGRSWEVGDGF